MNKKSLDLIKNFSYTISSNLISLLISTIVVLVVPKLIGVEEYGYWQLYIFYTSYVGFLHLGWNDGIYLRYGGKHYKDLDKKLFYSQYYMLALLQFAIAILIILFSSIYLKDFNRIFIIQMTAIALILVNLRFMLLFILQATNRIKRYAQITMIDRVLYIFIIVMLLIVGIRDYKMMIGADLVGKLISLTFAMFSCKDIVFRKVKDFYFSINEAIMNINVGIKLMLSNIAGKFIIGFVKLGIERNWDISTFGKVSLTLSISNLLMLFINAVGVIMYPILRRTEERKLPDIYLTMRDILMLVLLGALITYYPLKSILSTWLPDYKDSLMYMAILFPIVIFEGKMSLLINTYLKALRKEKLILFINVITVVISGVVTIITTFILSSLDLAIMSIVFLLGLRGILAEFLLSRVMTISINKDVILEMMMSLIFIFTAWSIDSPIGMAIYVVAYMIYIYLKKESLNNSFATMKRLMKA